MWREVVFTLCNPVEMDFNKTALRKELEFEEQPRLRCNTWPRQNLENRPHDRKDPATDQETTKSTNRRAWGNFSYADLITQAIISSSEQRRTLSEIYDWFLENVPYFTERGESHSSAGWKNSIRHNLSLHNRFLRVQNANAGKSSWWMLNPESKGKLGRRRAMTMDTTKAATKKPGVRKRTEKNRQICNTPSLSSSHSEGHNFPQQLLPPVFHPAFRVRTYSSSSSCGKVSPLASDDVLSNYVIHKPCNFVTANCQEPTTKFQYRTHIKKEPTTFFPSYVSTENIKRYDSKIYPSSVDGAANNLNCQYVVNVARTSVRTLPTSREFEEASGNGTDIEDINISAESLQEPIQCNVEEVISHELNIDGTLDFN